MTDNDLLTKIDLLKRRQLIKRFHCFAGLSFQQTTELASLFQEESFSSKAIIVNESDLIDRIYIIASGEAEVSITTSHKHTRKQVPVALLHRGESIGLTDYGFYSTTGKRTATVTALTNLLLLKLNLDDLHQFLQKYHLEQTMVDASDKMLRLSFIKQSLPFTRISHERLSWLADRIEARLLAAGTVIFQQGEIGDSCYLIRKGEVEIVAKTPHGEPHLLAQLKPPVLFGEAALITNTPRNATAIAKTDCELFVLHRADVSELIESEKEVAQLFMTLMVDRSRPKRDKNVIVHKRTAFDGQEIIILKHLQTINYFKLSPEGYYVWQHLDGDHTLQEITLGLAQAFHVFAPDMVVALISKLTKSGYIDNLAVLKQNMKSETRWLSAFKQIRKILDVRVTVGDADRIITKTYQTFMRYFFTEAAQIILAVFALIGFCAFIVHISIILNFFRENQISLLLLLTLLPFSLIAVLLHELGHAYAVKAFGREIHFLGVGWYWAMPIAFTDTSDMWLSNRKDRMIVNLAGIYVDVLVAAFSALLIFVFSNPYLQAMLWLFSLYTYIGAFRMLSPLQEMDGYYVLMDWVERPRLRYAAVLWLIRGLPKALRNPKLLKEQKPEIAYWLAVFVYLILVTIVTLLLQSFLLNVLRVKITNPYLVLVLPFLVVLFSSFSMLVQIKNKAEE